MLPNFYLSLHELYCQPMQQTKSCKVSFVHLLVINKNIQILTMGRDVIKSVGRVIYVFLHFVLQEEVQQ